MARFKICVVGLGYIGLPTATVMANAGHEVVGVDTKPSTVESINQGKAHIVEPDLDGALKSAVESGNLRAQATAEAADFYAICVPTPFHHDEGAIPRPNVDYVFAAAEAVAPFLEDGSTVIIESTSPVGTTRDVAERLRELTTARFHIAYCPERVLPGKIMTELVENDRIVGGETPEAAERVAELYATFIKGQVLRTDDRTAEMAKLVENSYRDVNIAFANELSMLCDRVGIDVWELIALANHHPRVKILQPGAGVGGHCIAVDPWFIVAMDPERSRLIESARRVNDSKPEFVMDKVCAAADRLRAELGREPRVTCLGLAFKPNVDDFRESPALHIFEGLRARGLQVDAVEPYATDAVAHAGLVGLDEALASSDLLVGLVKHQQFAGLDSAKLMDFCGIGR
jgi:UDP-N-acetyl-D-mannosaminuronic acid dehydrogenase